MDTSFLTYILSIPSVSGHEEFITEKIVEWCKKHGIKTKQDAKGNLYLAKGSPKSGEYYVGATAHLDTVQHEQLPYIQEKKLLEPKVEGDKITMWMGDKQTGTGSDDKNAIAIILSMMTKTRAMKAAFYVGEETGMIGAKASDMSFWDDVAWVFGCDSPGPDSRATKYTSGVKLFTDDFFDKYLGPVCKKHGITDFRSEPFTDLATLIRRGASDGKFICSCNLRNGGENAHSSKEWCSIRVANDTEQCGLDLIDAIPLDKRYVMDKEEEQRSYSYSGYGYGSSYSSPWRSSWNSGNDKFESKGHFVWAFNTPAIKDKYVERMKPRFGETLKLEEVGKQSVKVSGEFLYLRSAYMFAFNYDNGTSYTSWMDFERNERTAAGRFDSDFKADPVEKKKEPAGENWRKKQHGQYDDGVVYVRIDSDEDMDVVETRIFDSGVPVDMEREPEGLSIAGPLVSIQRAFAIASDALNGTNHRFFPNLDKESQEEFWKSVAFDNDEDEGEFDDVIDADYTMVDDKPPADSDDEEDDLFSWMRKQQQKKEEPKKDDLLRGHSPDERCSMKLQLPPSQPGFTPLFKSKVGDRVSIAEIGENALEISGKLSDVVAAALEYMNLWLRSDRYRSLADLPPSQIDNFWKELEFKK